MAAALDRLAAARGDLMPWAPVCIGAGIGLYFCLPEEPAAAQILLYAAVIPLAIALRRLGGARSWAPSNAVMLIALGLLLAALRAWLVAAPVLPYRYFGPAEGRVVDIDRSFSDNLRLTLDQVVLPDLADAAPPARVRVALHGDGRNDHLVPGQRLRLTAHLSPPDGPVEPGGFDFQRLAWFSRLGAVGYTRDPVIELAAPDTTDWRLWAFRLRMALSRQMQAGMGEGQAAALAAAFMTGDRSGIDAATNDSMRASNLSHLISISGLHMGLITGFVFATVRGGLALFPPVALRVNGRKIAALIAMLAATFYLALAGPDVATRRAFIMAIVMMLAVLADRRAISVRSVAISALIVLGLEPESLVEPGFQMSFAATLALVVAFGWWPAVQMQLPALTRPIAVAVLSSLVAGTATAPIAAAHFNRVAEYGLLANLLATPLMALAVMPAGVLALLLLPLGLAGPVLWVMRLGTEGVLWISDWVAGLEGAVVPVVTPPPAMLPVLAAGGLLLLLGQGAVLRGFGAVLAAGAVVLWAGAARPDMLIAADGGLVGVMTAEGRALSKPKGAGFVASNWLENDGDAATQDVAAARPAFAGARGDRRAVYEGKTIIHLTGKSAPDRAKAACQGGVILVLAGRWQGDPPTGCRLFDTRHLRRTGSVALWNGRVETARDRSGWRYWNSRRLRESVLP